MKELMNLLSNQLTSSLSPYLLGSELPPSHLWASLGLTDLLSADLSH